MSIVLAKRLESFQQVTLETGYYRGRSSIRGRGGRGTRARDRGGPGPRGRQSGRGFVLHNQQSKNFNVSQ